jgi:hypothetical protein
MNRWGRIVVFLSAVAGVAWAGAGLLGYRVVDAASLARHTLFSFSALLALVLAHCWVAVYLLTLERLLARRAAIVEPDAAALARARRRGLSGALLAIGAVVAQFSTANALYPGRIEPRWHALAGLASVLALLAALWLETGALRRAGAAVATRRG